MSDNSGTRSVAVKFWRSCLYLFGGVALLVITIEMLKQIWWILLLVAMLVLGVVMVVRWWRYSRW